VPKYGISAVVSLFELATKFDGKRRKLLGETDDREATYRDCMTLD